MCGFGLPCDPAHAEFPTGSRHPFAQLIEASARSAVRDLCIRIITGLCALIPAVRLLADCSIPLTPSTIEPKRCLDSPGVKREFDEGNLCIGETVESIHMPIDLSLDRLHVPFMFTVSLWVTTASRLSERNTLPHEADHGIVICALTGLRQVERSEW